MIKGICRNIDSDKAILEVVLSFMVKELGSFFPHLEAKGQLSQPKQTSIPSNMKTV